MPTTRHDERHFDGLHYPVGYLVAILGDGRQAGQAARALRDAGLTDVVVFDGPQALQAIESKEQKESPLARAWDRLALQLSDDTDGRREALAALRQGHAWVAVHASGGAQVDQAEGILRAHGAHAPRFFGRWAITDLTG